MPTTSWTCPPRSSSASSSTSERSSPMQSSSVTVQPRVHLLTTPTPSRYYEPKGMGAQPVGMGAQPSSSPGVSSSPQPHHQHQGIGAAPQRGSPSPLMELQVQSHL